MSSSAAIADKAKEFFDHALVVGQKKALRTWKKIKKSDSWQLAGILTVVAFFCFITTYISNMFTIPLGGDFVLQMIPFQFKGYDDWHSFFATGVFPTWDSQGIFGISNIGGNSYYYLFDPWFLVMIFFPRNWLPQLQGIGTMVKLVTGGMLFYHYLKSFKISVSTRKIGAVCYAFCGWTFYYLWFHFINITAVLPLLFWGIELVIQKKRPMMLMGSLALLCFINYYFFICFCFGSVLYALFRVLQTWRQRKVKENFKVLGMGVACYAIAILTVMICLLPSVLNTLNMPRVSSDSSFIDMIKDAEGMEAKLKLIFTWSQPYKVLYPLNTFLVAPLGCFSPSLFSTTGYDNTAASIYVTAPMMLMLIPSVLDSIKRRKWSHLIGCAIVTLMLFTPFTYYFMFAFVKEYGRWEIMATMWMLIFFLIHFDKRKEMPRWYMDVSLVFTAALYAIMLPLAFKYANDPAFSTISGSPYRPLNALDSDHITAIIVQCIWVFVCYVIMRSMLHRSNLSRTLLVMVCAESIVVGNVTVRMQGLATYQNLSGGLANVNEERKIVSLLEDYDDSFYRIFNTSADRGSPNLSLREGYNGVAAFHSVYAYEAQDFINWSRIPYTSGNWSMGVHEKRYNLDTFMGVKYYLVKKPTGTDMRNIPYGYTDITTKEDCPEALKKVLEEGNHELYVNENYIDTGFVFDNIISSANLSSGTYADRNEEKYLSYGIVDAEELDEVMGLSREVTTTPVVSHLVNVQSFSDLNASYKIYKANFDENGYLIPGNSNQPDQYGIYDGDTELDFNTQNATELPIYSKIVVDLKPNSTICPDAETRDGCYVSVDYKFGYNIDFAFFDAEGNKITNDMHMWNGYDKTSDWKYARGFYVDRPATRVVATLRDNIIPGFVFEKFNMFFSYNDIYQAKIDKLKSRALSNLEHVRDSLLTFETDYDRDQFVVTNYAYDEGWTLYRRDKNLANSDFEELKYYKGQGGFISFMAYKGDYEYRLEYKTPGLDFSKGFTILGAMSQFIIYGVYLFLDQKKRLYNNPKLSLKRQKPRRVPKRGKL